MIGVGGRRVGDRLAGPGDRNAFLALKTLNLVAITAYSFQLVYVLVRVLSLDLYPAAVLVASIGIYVTAADLGYSGVVYHRTRTAYLAHAPLLGDGAPGDAALGDAAPGGGARRRPPPGAAAEAFTLYLAVSLAAAAAAGVAIAVGYAGTVPPATRLALALYFCSIVLALPWGLVRRLAAAVDLYLAFELCELARRLFFVAASLAMLAGLPFLGFTVLCLLAWAAAFAGATALLGRRRAMPLLARSPRAVLAHVRSNWRAIRQSGALTLAEFTIYNFPYLAIPLLFDDPVRIVAFDVFYKVVRFGAVAYAVPAETALPEQTRALHAGDRPGVLRAWRRVILLGLLPLAVAAPVLLAFGAPIFAVLLSRGGIVDADLRVAMAVMLAALLAQNSAGTFLLGAGQYGRMARRAMVTLALMAGVVGLTRALRLPFGDFMYLYAGAYCVHAALCTALMRRFLAAMRPTPRGAPPAAPDAAAPDAAAPDDGSGSEARSLYGL